MRSFIPIYASGSLCPISLKILTVNIHCVYPHENFRPDSSLNKALIFKPNSELTRN